MKTITVTASRNYNVYIGSGLLSAAGSLVKKVNPPCRAALVTDSNVSPLYSEKLALSLISQGFQVIRYVFPAGEASKNGRTYLELLNFLAENRLTRSDLLIALGGGVVGDLTGFAAATYLRGISYIQIPTTLLAMVDSSVGGKTAIDLPAGKNLAGAFYQPEMVICDIDCLHTLPAEIFRDGCAEVIKYGILYDRFLFLHLMEAGLHFLREDVIARCVELKRDVVAQDEFDTGARQKLNLGHTIGHSIEAASGYAVSHGLAVAAGMAVMARSALAAGLCAPTDCSAILETLTRFGLPTGTNFPAEILASAALSDKKRSGGTVNLILPRAIGDCVIVPTPVEKLTGIIEAGL